MAGNLQGARRTKETLLKKYGSEEAYRAHFREMGRKGGLKGTTGGFASEKVGEDGLTGIERAMVAGSKGGKLSKRGPRKAKKEA